jgi:chaperonin GroES
MARPEPSAGPVPRTVATSTKPSPRVRPRAGRDRVRLTGDRIIVEHPDDGERTSRGGLLIPATASPAPKRCLWGKVVLVGPDVRTVKEGDRVLFLPQSGLEVELHDQDYLLLRERDVQAVATAEEDGSEREPGQYL